MPILYAILSLYALWVFYLAIMNLKRAKDAGTMTPVAKVLGYGIAIPGGILDVVINVLSTLVFIDIPRELTLSQRLSRYYEKEPDSWRGKVATWAAKNLLNTYDPSGEHIK